MDSGRTFPMIAAPGAQPAPQAPLAAIYLMEPTITKLLLSMPSGRPLVGHNQADR